MANFYWNNITFKKLSQQLNKNCKKYCVTRFIKIYWDIDHCTSLSRIL